MQKGQTKAAEKKRQNGKEPIDERSGQMTSADKHTIAALGSQLGFVVPLVSCTSRQDKPQ